MKKYVLYDNQGQVIQTVSCPETEIGLYNFSYIEVDEDFEFDSNSIYTVVNGEVVTTEDTAKVLSEAKEVKKSELLALVNYEAPVLVGTTYYKGGYESAQKLDSKRRLIVELGGDEVQYIDSNDVIVALTLEEAKTVCLAVADAYETKFYYYKSKKAEITSATTIKELEMIEL